MKEELSSLVAMPTKTSYLNLKITKGALDAYGTFKNNIFLSNNKTSLSIILNPLTRFSKEGLLALLKRKMEDC